MYSLIYSLNRILKIEDVFISIFISIQLFYL